MFKRGGVSLILVIGLALAAGPVVVGGQGAGSAQGSDQVRLSSIKPTNVVFTADQTNKVIHGKWSLDWRLDSALNDFKRQPGANVYIIAPPVYAGIKITQGSKTILVSQIRPGQGTADSDGFIVENVNAQYSSSFPNAKPVRIGLNPKDLDRLTTAQFGVYFRSNDLVPKHFERNFELIDRVTDLTQGTPTYDITLYFAPYTHVYGEKKLIFQPKDRFSVSVKAQAQPGQVIMDKNRDYYEKFFNPKGSYFAHQKITGSQPTGFSITLPEVNPTNLGRPQSDLPLKYQTIGRPQLTFKLKHYSRFDPSGAVGSIRQWNAFYFVAQDPDFSNLTIRLDDTGAAQDKPRASPSSNPDYGNKAANCPLLAPVKPGGLNLNRKGCPFFAASLVESGQSQDIFENYSLRNAGISIECESFNQFINQIYTSSNNQERLDICDNNTTNDPQSRNINEDALKPGGAIPAGSGENPGSTSAPTSCQTAFGAAGGFLVFIGGGICAMFEFIAGVSRFFLGFSLNLLLKAAHLNSGPAI